MLSPILTLDDLRSGRVSRLTERQYATLRNCSMSLLQKERVTGRGIRFIRTPSGRIFYDAADVLAELDETPRHASTCEYDTGSKPESLCKARQSKRA